MVGCGSGATCAAVLRATEGSWKPLYYAKDLEGFALPRGLSMEVRYNQSRNIEQRPYWHHRLVSIDRLVNGLYVYVYVSSMVAGLRCRHNLIV
jgi:hypothetical protein